MDSAHRTRRATEGAITWLPRHDGHYILAGLLVSAREAEPVAFTQHALLAVERQRLRGGVGSSGYGLLTGRFCLSPQTELRFLLVDGLMECPPLDAAACDVPALMARDLNAQIVDATRRRLAVAGFYRWGTEVLPRASEPDVGVLRALFPCPWQLMLVCDHEGNGAVVRVEPSHMRAYATPFFELGGKRHARRRGKEVPRQTAVSWRTYIPSEPVTLIDVTAEGGDPLPDAANGSRDSLADRVRRLLRPGPRTPAVTPSGAPDDARDDARDARPRPPAGPDALSPKTATPVVATAMTATATTATATTEAVESRAAVEAPVAAPAAAFVTVPVAAPVTAPVAAPVAVFVAGAVPAPAPRAPEPAALDPEPAAFDPGPAAVEVRPAAPAAEPAEVEPAPDGPPPAAHPATGGGVAVPSMTFPVLIPAEEESAGEPHVAPTGAEAGAPGADLRRPGEHGGPGERRPVSPAGRPRAGLAALGGIVLVAGAVVFSVHRVDTSAGGLEVIGDAPAMHASAVPGVGDRSRPAGAPEARDEAGGRAERERPPEDTATPGAMRRLDLAADSLERAIGAFRAAVAGRAARPRSGAGECRSLRQAYVAVELADLALAARRREMGGALDAGRTAALHARERSVADARTTMNASGCL